MALPGAAVFVGGTLCSTVYNQRVVYNRGGSRELRLICARTSPTPKMHQSDLCPFVDTCWCALFWKKQLGTIRKSVDFLCRVGPDASMT